MAERIIFANNFSTTLIAGCAADDTTIRLTNPAGLPQIVLPGDYFYLTLRSPARDVEIVKVTAIDGDELTIERGREGTIPFAFDGGCLVQARVTAGAVGEMMTQSWARETAVVAFVDSTSFTVVGDHVERYAQHRAVRLLQTVEDHAYVTSSSFAGGLTTVTVVEGVVDAGLVAVEYGLEAKAAPRYTHAATAALAANADQFGGHDANYYSADGHKHDTEYEQIDSTILRQSDIGSKVLAPTGDGSNLTNPPGLYVGEIRLFPFRKNELPEGWYLCDGTKYSTSGAVGSALQGLSSTYRGDWDITQASDQINVPDLFDGSDGYFVRPVNGSARTPGATQSDAIRNITGHLGGGGEAGSTLYSTNLTGGSFYLGGGTGQAHGAGGGSGRYQIGYFDASRQVPTAAENRPINIGMLPAIYLGV